MSSTESFVGMMTGDEQVTALGEPTCGSSGNPQVVKLPLDLTVTMPQWLDYKPDGKPLDEHGFEPRILFTPTPGAFGEGRDDLLTAALARFRP
jgi:C-terminal processing protease CtpA/Prc